MTRFSDSTNRDGLIQQIEKNTGTQSATASSYPLKVKTLDINETLGYFFLLAIKAGGRFQVDDTNQTDQPVITTALVSGQSDYTFLVDGSTPANQVLDVRQVRIKNSSGEWTKLTQIDREVVDISTIEAETGEPTEFDITGNSIILYPAPNYSQANSLELYISRTPVYFVSTDTTKEAGIPKIFHPYLHLRPSYLYTAIKTLPQAKWLKVEVDKMEEAITDYYSRRNRTEGNGRLKVRQESNR